MFLTLVPGTTVFHYLFTIANAFQGVWVAVLHLAFEYRKDMRKLIKKIRQKNSRSSAYEIDVTRGHSKKQSSGSLSGKRISLRRRPSATGSVYSQTSA